MADRLPSIQHNRRPRPASSRPGDSPSSSRPAPARLRPPSPGRRLGTGPRGREGSLRGRGPWPRKSSGVIRAADGVEGADIQVQAEQIHASATPPPYTVVKTQNFSNGLSLGLTFHSKQVISETSFPANLLPSTQERFWNYKISPVYYII